jgi:hypothetical protein
LQFNIGNFKNCSTIIIDSIFASGIFQVNPSQEEEEKYSTISIYVNIVGIMNAIPNSVISMHRRPAVDMRNKVKLILLDLRT